MVSKIPESQQPKKFTGIGDKFLYGLTRTWGIGRLVRAILPIDHKYSQTSREIDTIYQDVIKLSNKEQLDEKDIKKLEHDKKTLIKDRQHLEYLGRLGFLRIPFRFFAMDGDYYLPPDAEKSLDKARLAGFMVNMNLLNENEAGDVDIVLINYYTLYKMCPFLDTDDERYRNIVGILLNKADKILKERYERINDGSLAINPDVRDELIKKYNHAKLDFDPQYRDE